MENGYLTVQAYTANGFLPLEDCQVFITSEDETILFTVETTNRLGRTVVLTVETPPKELTIEPSDEKVFTSCSVFVNKEGFFNLAVRGVQVFARELSIQNAVLSPLPNNFQGDTLKVIQITPQNL